MKQEVFFLVDCNNFFVSCERVFNPSLNKRPVIVLSNNDGCIIARSNEAKKLGMPMAAPVYQYKKLIEQHNIAVLSSNFNLYKDISRRIMSILKEDFIEVEIYSIDEAFIKINDYNFSFEETALRIKNKISQFVGIPVSIGISFTKTLAKIAGAFAKKSSGVFSILDYDLLKTILSQYPIEEIWGIGEKTAKKMRMLNIGTAQDLSNYNIQSIRKSFSIIFEKISCELKGQSCLDIQLLHNAKKSIRFSRSFSQKITSLEELEQVLSNYTSHASVNLRKENLKTKQICVFLRTNPFKKNAQYRNSMSYTLPRATSNTNEIFRFAKYALNIIYKANYEYHKIGILLFDLVDKDSQQLDFFNENDDNKSNALMTSLDKINQKMGKNTVFFASQGTTQQWESKKNMQSPEYTTNWNDLVKVY